LKRAVKSLEKAANERLKVEDREQKWRKKKAARPDKPDPKIEQELEKANNEVQKARKLEKEAGKQVRSLEKTFGQLARHIAQARATLQQATKQYEEAKAVIRSSNRELQEKNTALEKAEYALEKAAAAREKLEERRRELENNKQELLDSIINKSFEGKVHCSIRPPVSINRLTQFRKLLSGYDGLQCLMVGGSADEGLFVLVNSIRPLPLLRILREMEPVESALEESGGITVKLVDA